MRVLFTSVAPLGHVHPMVPLARALMERGHELRWVTGPDACQRLGAIGINAIPAGSPFGDYQELLRRRYPEIGGLAPQDLPESVFPRLFGEIAAAAMLPDMLAAARTWKPDLVVHDAAEFTGTVAAATLGVSCVTHSYGSLVPPSRVAGASERLAALWRSVGLEPRPYGGSYDQLYLDIYPPSLQVADMGHVGARQSLRPVAFDAAGEEGAFDLRWSDTDRPLVYVTFGTVNWDVGPLRTAVAAIASLPVRVLVTVGPSGEPGSLGSQPANVRVERYVPQTRVLPDCAVVASHAGSGTFLAALGLGIPQLCLPQRADQFLNAAACVRADAGIAIEPGAATADAIVAAVSRLLGDATFKARAAVVAQEMASMPPPDQVAAVLERLTVPA